MRNNFIQPVDLTDDDRNRLIRLLNYSWSAEYALRIRPVVQDADYLKTCLQWTLPQAFFAVQHSLKAVMLTLNVAVKYDISLMAASESLHKNGLYESAELPADFFHELAILKHRFFSHADNEILDIDASAEQYRLIGLVTQIATAHETHIMECLGIDAYWQLVGSVSAYLWDDFLLDRTNRIAAHLAEKEVILC